MQIKNCMQKKQFSYPEMNILGFVVLAVLLYATSQAKYNHTGQSLTPRF